MIHSPFDSALLLGFSDEMQKIANLGPTASQNAMPSNPTGLSEIKATIPDKPLSGKTPKFSKVHSAPVPSPATMHQPVVEAPPVRR